MNVNAQVPSITPTIWIVNDKGRPFIARVVRKGDNYGLDFCITYGEGKDAFDWNGKPKDEAALDPMVEFYDATLAGDNHWGPFGQFVSRYYVRTILDGDDYRGLCLDGGNADVWGIDGDAMFIVRQWLQNVFKGYEFKRFEYEIKF